MMDLVVRTERAPAAGETLMGDGFGRFPGGKGANQAVAAARLGGVVAMAGKVGRDAFGDEGMAVLADNGVDTAHMRRDDVEATGIALIVVERSGQNRIIIAPGANMRYTTDEADALEEAIRGADMLVMQLEIDLAVVERAAAIAQKHGVPVLLNPAPARPLPAELLSRVAVLTPNETELELLTGMKADGIEAAQRAARTLIDLGVKHVVVTLAERGALVCSAEGCEHVEGFPVTPVDTVAAGDSFNGALAVKLAEGASLHDAAKFANAVGALAVTKQGAIPSLPTLAEVERFLTDRENA